MDWYHDVGRMLRYRTAMGIQHFQKSNLVGGVNRTRHAGVETTQTGRYEDGYLLHFGTARQYHTDDSLRAR